MGNSAGACRGARDRATRRHRSVEDGRRKTKRRGILHESFGISGGRNGIVADDERVAGRPYADDLEVAHSSRFPSRLEERSVRRADDGTRRIEGVRIERPISGERGSEFVGIELEFRPIGISGRIVRSRFVPVASSQDDVRSSVGESNHGSGQRGSRIVDDVVSRRISGRRRFRGNGGIHGSHVRFRTGFRGIFGISGKRYEGDRGENREDGDDDEFGKSESETFLSWLRNVHFRYW